MASDLNAISMTGFLATDPELRYTPSGTQEAKFRLASHHVFKDGMGRSQDEVTFVTVKTFGGIAENANIYLNKGSRVAITGRLALPQWTNKKGEPRSDVVVVANSIHYLDRKVDAPDARAPVA
jgi:single-strand DNA-binding protein